ncbi:MAG: D-ribose pyranase [Chloroflexota bacterium]|nr:D-ribose pyranase [Chloroflexota bacterium]
MKKGNLLNAPLTAVIARLGHTDRLVIGDAGLPIPSGVERIDLAVRPGLPHFLDVVRTTLEEMVVEKALIAEELETVSPELHGALVELLGDIEIRTLPHEEFKVETKSARAVVRTGEFTPYANVILYSGVVF